MQNIVKTLMSGFKTLVNKKIRGSVADWNQNDPTAPDYVKNRLAWTDDPVETVLIEEQTVTVGDGLYALLDGSLVLEVGKTYTVNFNGTAYDCVAYSISNPDIEGLENIVFIGNAEHIGLWGGNGEPFTFDSHPDGGIYLDTPETGDYIISISDNIAEVHKIDEKYLPDNVIESIYDAQTTAETALASADAAHRILPFISAEGTSPNYTATSGNVTSLYNGMLIAVVFPKTDDNNSGLTLNINNLGAIKLTTAQNSAGVRDYSIAQNGAVALFQYYTNNFGLSTIKEFRAIGAIHKDYMAPTTRINIESDTHTLPSEVGGSCTAISTANDDLVLIANGTYSWFKCHVEIALKLADIEASVHIPAQINVWNGNMYEVKCVYVGDDNKIYSIIARQNGAVINNVGVSREWIVTRII